MDKLIQKILNDIRVELTDEFDRNFSRKAFFDHSWPPRKMNGKGSLLIVTGKLRRSIRSRVDAGSVTWETSEPYAAIHNYGGHITVTAKMKRYFWYRFKVTKDDYWKHMALMKVGSKIHIPGQTVMMQMAEPRLIATLSDNDKIRLSSIMGLKEQTNMPFQIVSTGLPDIMLPIADINSLQNLHPDMKALSAFSEALQVVGVHAFALSDDGFTAHVRNFAPLYGIDEESVTGTSNAALTYYLFRNGIVKTPAQCKFLQGEAMQRPSIITTTLSTNDLQCEIMVGGPCCIVAQGELMI